MAERVAVFIDGNNFRRAAERVIGIRPNIHFDFARLAAKLCGPERLLVAAYYYGALSDREDNPVAYDNETRFLARLERLPRFRVVRGYLLKVPAPGRTAVDVRDRNSYIHVEKGTDVNLAIDMLIGVVFNAWDTAILLSADADFARLVRKARDFGKVVEIAIPAGTPAGALVVEADYCHNLSVDFLNDCWAPGYGPGTFVRQG